MEALRGFILKRFPNLYLALYACGDQDQAYIDRQKQKVIEDNEGHKEEYMRSKYHPTNLSSASNYEVDVQQG